jgi:uncharacterized protein YbaP (TraB family)
LGGPVDREMILIVKKHQQLRIVALCALFLVVCPAFAESPDRSFLWRVTSPTSTLHLLGSIHLMKPTDYPLGASIEEAYSASRVVVFEVDLDEMAGAGMKLLSAGTLPPGTTLRDVVSAETHELISSRLAEFGLEAGGFENMRPWLLATTLTAFELTRAGYSQSAGIDMHFFERAKRAGKGIVGLETAEFQVGLFSGLDAGQDEAFLRQTLEELESVIPEVEELMKHWRVGDVDEVEQLLTEAYDEYPVLFRKIVADRNHNWLPQLEEILAGDEDAMAIVGSLHMVGEDGMVELLRKAGYTVEQL